MAAFYTTTTPLSPNSPTPLYPVFGYTLDDDCEPAAHGQGEQLGLAANVDFSAIPLLNEPSSLRSQSLSTHVPPPSIHIQPSADPGHPQPPTGRGNPSSSTTFDTNNHNPDIQPYVTPVEGIRPVYFEPFAQGRGKDGTAPSGGLVCGLQDETKIDILTDLFRSVFHRSSPSCNTTTTAKNPSETPDNTKSNSSTNKIDLDGDHQNRQAPVGILCFTAEDGTKGILEAVDRALGGSTSSTQNVQESFLGAEIIVLTPTANVARLKDLCSAYPEVKVYPLLVHLNDIEIDHVHHLLLLNRDEATSYRRDTWSGKFDVCDWIVPPEMDSREETHWSAVECLTAKYLSSKPTTRSSRSGHYHQPPLQDWITWLREGQQPLPTTAPATKGPKVARPIPALQSQTRNQTKITGGISQQPDTPLSVTSDGPSPSNSPSSRPFILCVDWTGMPADARHVRNLLGDIVLKNWLRYCHPTDETTGNPTATAINSLIVCDNAEHYLSADMEGPFSKSVVQLITSSSSGALYHRSAVSGQSIEHISMLTTQGELVDMDHPCQTWPQPSKTFPVSEAGGAKGPSTHLVVLSQSPTKLSTDILDRLSYVILHRFTAPRWLHFLENHFHLTISQSKAPEHSTALLMEIITKLEEDEVLVYSSFIKHPMKKGQQGLGGRPIKLKLQSGLDAGQLGTIVLQYHAKKSQQRASSKQATAATSVTNTSHLSGRPNNGLATDEDPSLRSYSPFLSQRLGLSKTLDISQNEDMRRNQGSRSEHRQLAPLISGTQTFVDPTTEYASRTARPWITQTMSNSISTASDATAIPAQIGGIHPSTTSTHGFNTSRTNGHIGNTYDNQTWDHTLPPSGSSLLSPSSTVGDTSRFSKPSAFMQIGSAAATSLGISPGGIRPHISPSNGFPSRMQTSGGNFPPSPGMSSFTGGPSSPSYFHTPGFTGVSISPGRPGSGNPNTFSPFLNTSGLSNDDPIMRGNGRDVRLTHATDNSYSAYSQKQQPISSSSETGAFQIPSATSFSSDSQSRSRADTSTDSSSAEFVDIGEGISFKNKADVGVIGGGVPGTSNSNQSPTATRNGGSGYGLGSLVSPKKSYAVVTAPGRSNGPLISRQDTIIGPANQRNTVAPSSLIPNPLSPGDGLGRTHSKDPSHPHVSGTSMSSVDSITQQQYQSHLQQPPTQPVVPPPNYPESFFWPLLDALEKARAQVSTPHNRAQSVRHSVVGQELPPAARTRIGLTFKEYVAAAARAGVIVTGDSGDKAWIALRDWKYPGKNQPAYSGQVSGSGTKIIIR